MLQADEGRKLVGDRAAMNVHENKVTAIAQLHLYSMAGESRREVEAGARKKTDLPRQRLRQGRIADALFRA